MIQQLKEVLNGIRPSSTRTNSMRIEFIVIHSALKELEWLELSSSAKQEKRKRMLQSMKKYREEDGLQRYDYENAIISFYDSGKSVLSQIDNVAEPCLSVKRLSVLLLLDLKEIDSSYSLFKKKNLTPAEVYRNVQADLREDKVDILELENIIGSLEVINSFATNTTPL